MAEGMSNFSLDFNFYEHFVYGKQNQERFPYSATRVEGILQLLHSDVFGLVLVPSLGKSVYYVSFIDDLSRNNWIYFLKKKSKSFDRYKEFKALIENQTEKLIKVLRKDNGGEFCWNQFEEFYTKFVKEIFASPHANCSKGLSISLCRLEVPCCTFQSQKIMFFHIYMPYKLDNMRICRLHHYNPYTSGFVPKIKKLCQVSMSRHKIHDP
jgi:hypothetical protein